MSACGLVFLWVIYGSTGAVINIDTYDTAKECRMVKAKYMAETLNRGTYFCLPAGMKP